MHIPIDAHLNVLLKRVMQLPPLDPLLPAHRTLGIVRDVLNEAIFRRSPQGSEVLRENVEAGYVLLRDCDRYLASADGSKFLRPEITAAESFEGLIAQANDVAALLHGRARQVVDLRGKAGSVEQDISVLLLRAAEWEMAFFDARAMAIAAQIKGKSSEEFREGLTLEKLQFFMRRARCDDELTITSMNAISGGMGKTTWLADVNDDGTYQELVVRQELPKQLNSGCAFAIADEFELLKILFAAGLPVPQPLHLCTDLTIAATHFHVTPRVAGAAPGDFFGLRDGVAIEAVLDLAASLAKLHALPIANFTEYVSVRGRESVLVDSVRENYLKSIRGWRWAVESYGIDRSPSIVFTLDWLENNVPDDERPLVLTHGDANLHNIMVADGRMSALLDWELADFGGPEQDLAYIKPNIEKLIPWDNFLAHYAENGGPVIRDEYFPFHLAYQLMRLYVGALNGQAMLANATHDDERLIEIDLNYVPLELRMILDVIRR